jgi:hypothetical protein
VKAARIRFVLEAGFIVVVAAVCWAAHLTWRGIVPAMAAAWLLVTLVERSLTQDGSLLRRGRTSAAPEPAGAVEPSVPDPPVHVTLLEPEPAAEHPPTPMPPDPEPPAPEPAPPVPEPDTPEPEEPVPQLEVVPDPEPEPEPDPVAAVAYLPTRDGAPREWNVWELERIARETEGRDRVRDQELAFLLIELRQFADADGRLADSFDPVVRETFRELLYASA